jgi:hypothetical protein
MPSGKPSNLRLPGGTEIEPVIFNDQYLRPMLDSGSSRVFNCNDRVRELLRTKAEAPYFFRLPKLHGLVLIKEVSVANAARADAGEPLVGTKLYMPYNEENVYEGGRSIFYNDPRMLDTISDLFGLRGASVAEADLSNDLKILGILDRLPSLDGFLMRDALELDGIATNEAYFEISGTERAAINEFIRHKFEPLVRAACDGDAAITHKVDHLIDKIWEAKDRDALQPLIRAFRFPDDEALAIFAAWKGINFYTYEYTRAKPQREQFALWLRDRAKPRNFVSKPDQDYIAQVRRGTLERLRDQWNVAEGIAHEYETLYANFLRMPEGVVDFVNFLRRSRTIYWRMGDALSKINHAIHCWDAFTATFSDRRLPADKLTQLLEMLPHILSRSDQTTSAVVWQ